MPTLADTATTQPLHPRLKEHHRKGGGETAGARGPGRLLQDFHLASYLYLLHYIGLHSNTIN